MHLFKSKESIGIIFGIFAYLSFSILDAIQKTLILHHSIFQLLLVKYFFVLFLALFESKRKNNHFFYKSKDIAVTFSIGSNINEEKYKSIAGKPSTALKKCFFRCFVFKTTKFVLII